MISLVKVIKLFSSSSLMLWTNKLEHFPRETIFGLVQNLLVRQEPTLKGTHGLTYYYSTPPKMIVRQKCSSLFVRSISDEEKKVL